MTNEAKPRVYDVLAKAFIQEGVKTCFTLMGDANMNWAARLAQQGCRMVYVRHEHCAVAAAMSLLVTPEFGLESAPQPIEISAIAPG